MKARLRFLFFIFIFFLYSNTTSEHSTSSPGTIRQNFLNSNFTADPKAFPHAAPLREPETILLEESDETNDAGETREEGLPKPLKVGDKVFISSSLPSHATATGI